MIDGFVDETRQPVIEIELIAGQTRAVAPIVVDTGFSGEICLSVRAFGDIDLERFHTREYESANGEIVTIDVFRGRIVFDGVERPAEIILTDSADSLLGATMLKDRTLMIDYPGQTVRIE